MRNRFGKWITSAAHHNDKLILLSGDIGFGIFDEFISEHPRKFINCGIAEQNMIGVAAGLAASGYIPIVYTIIPFLICRPYEFIRNLIAYQNLPVTLVGVGGGFSYDTLGHTHYGLEDLNLILGLPNFSVGLPCDPSAVDICMDQTLLKSGPSYIRLMKGGEQDLRLVDESNLSMPFIKRLKYCGDEFTILTHGGLVHEALQAANLLETEYGIKGSVVTTLNGNISGLLELCCEDIYLYEENMFPGVFGKCLINLEVIKRVKIYRYVNNEILGELSSRNEMLDKQGLSSKAMVTDILSLRRSENYA
jgi:transketolase